MALYKSDDKADIFLQKGECYYAEVYKYITKDCCWKSPVNLL